MNLEIVDNPSHEVIRKLIVYINRNINEGGFKQIATITQIPLSMADEWHEALSINQICAIALVGEDVIGASHIDIGHGRRRHVATLAVTVDKHFRRRGVGDSLIKSIIKQAREKEIKVIIAEPSENNKAAINLLKKNGFVENGRIQNGFKNDDETFEDLIIYQNQI